MNYTNGLFWLWGLNIVAHSKECMCRLRKTSYAWLPRKCDHCTDPRTDRWTNICQTKWSLCAAMLRKRHNKVTSNWSKYYVCAKGLIPITDLSVVNHCNYFQQSQIQKLPQICCPFILPSAESCKFGCVCKFPFDIFDKLHVLPYNVVVDISLIFDIREKFPIHTIMADFLSLVTRFLRETHFISFFIIYMFLRGYKVTKLES